MHQAWEAQEEALLELRNHKQPSESMEKYLAERTDELLAEKAVALKEETKQQGIYYVSGRDTTTGRPAAYCGACGAIKYHERIKVLAAWADRHAAKTGHPVLKP